jgi:ferritin-like metal-binding protein YciE
VGLFSKDIKSLDDLLRQSLGELLYTERRIAKALPGLAAKVSDPLLRRELERARLASEDHLARIEEVFLRHDASPRSIECPAIDGIFISAEELSEEIDDFCVLDTAIAAAMQAVATYSAARYMTAAAWLRQLGRPECARLLHANLVARQRAADALCSLAEQRLNARARGRGDDRPSDVALAG